METTTKLNYIIKEINTTPITGIYKAKQCIKERIDFYTNSINKLESISMEQMRKYSFVSEVLTLSENKEKETFTKKVLKQVVSIETHKFAPELNKLHFKNETFVKVPQITTIDEAIVLYIKSNSINQLKALYK